MTGRESFLSGANVEQAIGVADQMCSRFAEDELTDPVAVLATLALVARVAMVIHDGNVQMAQGLINGICESAKMEALNLAIDGIAS